MLISAGRLTVSRLMALIALLGVALAAGIYWSDHANVEQATVTANLRALAWGDATGRRRAADDLGGSAPASYAPVAAALAAAVLGDSAPEVRQAAVASLGRVLAAWALHKPAASPRSTGRVWGPLLGESDAEISAVRAHLRALGDAQPAVRHAAVEAFGHLQNSVRLTDALDAESFGPLDRLIDHPESGPLTRAAAVWSLARMVRPTAAGRTRALARVQGDPDSGVRTAGIQALAQAWPAVELYPLFLARRAAGTTTEERSSASRGMENLPLPPVELMPELLGLMTTDPIMAHVVPQILRNHAGQGRPLLAAIRPAAEAELKQADPQARLPATTALVEIDPDSAEAQAMLDPLWRRVLSQPTDITTQADYLLSFYHSSAAPLIPALRAELHSPDLGIRHKAAGLLWSIGPPAIIALDDLDAANRLEASGPFDQMLQEWRRLAQGAAP